MTPQSQQYDVFGDIHGHADELKMLLKKLGYEASGNSYKHPEKRVAVFVGDFIDRGPKIRETLQLVRSMCDSGNAMATIGNHEFNAVCYHTPKNNNGEYFRSHTAEKTHQHIASLDQFKMYPAEWKSYLDWFRELPMYLDLGDVRIVHAYWNDKHISWLKNNNPKLNREFLQSATDERNHDGIYSIVEDTLKGAEIALPNGMHFIDKDGIKRFESRVKWWTPLKDRKTLENVLIKGPKEIKDEKIFDQFLFRTYNADVPVFFGNYWLDGTPKIENDMAVCLDYSVAKGGMLAACRVDKNEANTSISKTLVCQIGISKLALATHLSESL